MDRPRRAETRGGYFINVKNRLGSRLPPGIARPPGFVSGPWDASSSGRHHIRNPKLRQYYLKEATFPVEVPIKPDAESCRNSEQGVHKEDTVFSVASQFNTVPADTNPTPQLSEAGMDAVSAASLLSPSTDAEYDKLLDVEAVPMPDGQLCLLALPPECTQGAGSSDPPYLKLICRFITDRKGVVSGILLVAANKIFFDPHKSLPLVQENGCEEYLFSCAVDDLTSIAFFCDVSRVHFSRAAGRKKTSKSKTSMDHRRVKKTHTLPESKTSQSQMKTASTAVPCDLAVGGTVTHQKQQQEEEEEEAEESRDMAEVERHLEQLALEINPDRCSEPEVPVRTRLMFVRMRQKMQVARRKGFGSLELGRAKTPPSRDAWFILQQDSSDELYAYLSQHRPDLYIVEGGEDEEACDEDDFVILDDREEGCLGYERARDEWEMVTVEESRVKVAPPIDKEPDGLSDILKQSVILDTQRVRELADELPPRTVGHPWKLAYSTSKHGASLKTLYRKLATSDSPVLLLIRDHNQQVFGGFLSHPLRPSDMFYGTGETFLFLLHPRFKCFHWTGENTFFIKGDLDSFAIGGGSGHFGLWLDEALYVGRSSPCFTFNNCSLSETSDFRVLELEAWTFW